MTTVKDLMDMPPPQWRRDVRPRLEAALDRLWRDMAVNAMLLAAECRAPGTDPLDAAVPWPPPSLEAFMERSDAPAEFTPRGDVDAPRPPTGESGVAVDSPSRPPRLGEQGDGTFRVARIAGA